MARNQAREVFTHDDRDLEVDTSNMLPPSMSWFRLLSTVPGPRSRWAREPRPAMESSFGTNEHAPVDRPCRAGLAQRLSRPGAQFSISEI